MSRRENALLHRLIGEKRAMLLGSARTSIRRILWHVIRLSLSLSHAFSTARTTLSLFAYSRARFTSVLTRGCSVHGTSLNFYAVRFDTFLIKRVVLPRIRKVLYIHIYGILIETLNILTIESNIGLLITSRIYVLSFLKIDPRSNCTSLFFFSF